ncbi:FAD synthetase family protein [Niallia endozanthoxylica]|uniref:FAD synthase n=1 Tax=Niallia endozanthoxylica TaxID=2036016 RepID=A0A5J5HJP8_9BACI|nr:FAD synthetase family protein [Niallia endozanthoxylica]KAA9021030.1 FAD synthetase family protein [Niallia endozanthoxylica]
METIYLTRGNVTSWQKIAKPSVMALGFFDGLHHGHRKVIQTALQKAKEKNVHLAVMSFFPHPKTVISNGKKQVCYLMTLSEKEEMLEQLGVDLFYIVQFEKEFASLPPEAFVAQYLLKLGVVHAVAGFDFSYGSRGLGNLDRLKNDSGGLIEVTKVEKVECNGEKVSSTCIRERLIKGLVEEIPHFLGRPYEVKANWDGVSIHLESYHTLPSPGHYMVTLKKGLASFKTELVVTEESVVQTCHRLPSHMAGELSILWHRQIAANVISNDMLVTI